jgi:hypothetical protein
MKTQLLCTFTNEDSFENIVDVILKTHELFSRKIFILKLQPSNELVISYNIIPANENSFLSNTIMVHRKKESNTMYTINALNKLIFNLNNGIVDKSFQINWDIYRNSMILTNGDSYKVLKTSLFRIVDIEK